MKYVVKSEGFILGTFYNANKHIELTEKQAATFLAEGRITPVETKAKKADAK